MPAARTCCITLFCLLFALALPAAADVVNATWNTATDVPVSASSYTATGNTVNFTLNFAPATGTNLTVVNNTGLPFISGTFDNLAQGQTVMLSYGGVTYNFVAHYYGGTGNDLVLVWANNRAFAWGRNDTGQAGDSTKIQHLVMAPVTTTGALSGKIITALAKNSLTSLALCSDGTVAAWGYNGYSQFGNNTNTDSTVPILVDTTSSLSALKGKTVVAIAVGTYHCMALSSDGTVAAWGYNGYGQLGNNSTTLSSAPVAVNTTSGVSALYGKSVASIAAGDNHSLALCADGTVVAWGYNNGAFGNNSYANSLVPVAVNTTAGISALYGKTVITIAAGSGYSLALCSDGTVASWGFNSSGQLGDNTTTTRLVPVAVSSTNGTSGMYGKTVSAIAAGIGLSMALCTDGSLLSWGYNTYGQLGNNSTVQSTVPVLVNTASGISALYGKTVTAIAMGNNGSDWSSHALAYCTDGTLAVWGYNDSGSLGSSSITNSAVPLALVTTSLAAGERVVNPANHSNTAETMILVAEPPPTLTTLEASTIGSTTTVVNGTVNPNTGAAAVSFDYGTTTAYGLNIAAAPGTVTGSTATAVTARLIGLAPLTTYHFSIKCGGYTANDLTFTTVNNDADLASLELSSGTLSPVFDPNTTNYAASVPSTANSVTLTPTLGDSNATVNVNGTMVDSGSASGGVNLVYGDNVITTSVKAQDGTTSKSYTVTVTRSLPTNFPVSYTSSGDVPVSVNAKGFNVTGSAVYFTLNYAPVTGANLTVVNNTGLDFINGTFSNLSQGQAVRLRYNGLYYSFVANYYGGTGNDLVLAWANNRAFSWGANDSGQIGDGTFTERDVMVPVTTTGILAGKTIIALAEGSSHSLALCSDGTLASWRNNGYGQLGNNTTVYSNVPTLVNTTTGGSALLGKTIVAISAGSTFSMALCSDGTVATWGSNFSGNLGNNSTSSSSTPVTVNTTNGVSDLYGKTVVAIAAGANHCLALCSDATLTAWGENVYGELGNNGSTNSPVPVAVNTASGTSSLYGKTVVAIAAGTYHSVALCSDGSVANWGNFIGNAPVASNTTNGASAINGKSVVSIAAGDEHSMALCADGTLAAWGIINSNGQLGTNNTNASNVPVLVATTNGVSALYGKTMVAISCAGYNSRDLCADGTLATWGAGASGNLGNNNTAGSLAPVMVNTGPLAAGERFISPSNGTNTAQSIILVAGPPALNNDASLASLATSAGSLNPSFTSATTSYSAPDVSISTESITLTPTLSDSNASIKVNGISVISGSSATVSLGYGDNMIRIVVTAEDGVMTQTYVLTVHRTIPASLAATFTSAGNVPVNINGFTATGSTVNFALNYAPATGTNLTVVNNTGLPFINGTFDNLAQGQAVALNYNGVTYNYVANYYGGTGNDLVLVWANNRAFAWGYNAEGEVGDNTTTIRTLPTPVSTAGVLAGKTVIAVSAGEYHALALCSDGTLAAWGDNSYGQLGNNSMISSHVPVAVNTASGISSLSGKTVVSIAAGSNFSLALCSDGTVAAWGYNFNSQLGDNTTTQRIVPVAVNTENGLSALYGKSVVAIAAGQYHSLALCSDGTVAAWGYNVLGILGNNESFQSSVPMAVNTTNGVSDLYGKFVVAVAVGQYHSLALCSDGTVATWGFNINGQLGNNSTTSSNVPVAVNTASGLSALYGKTVVSVASGFYHNIVLCSDGTVAAWGDNSGGQLGNNAFAGSSVPVAVNTASGVSALYGRSVLSLATGMYHCVVQCTDGSLVAWGSNSCGELGDSTTTQRNAPVLVNTSTLVAGQQFSTLPRNSSTAYELTMAVVAAPAYPAVTTQAAVAVTGTSVTLNGTVAAANTSMAVSFDYGTTNSYGTNVTAVPTPISSGTATPVSATLTGLLPGTTYHYRVNGVNSAGTLNGNDLTFTTLNNNANLASLVPSTGTLTPAFASGTLSYTTSVPYLTTSITVTPTLADTNAQVQVNGVTVNSGSASSSISLVEGNNTVSTTVTAQDGITLQTYTLTVVRAAGPTLSGLGLSSGTLSPTFASATTSYTATLPSSSSSTLTLTPYSADSNATVTINGQSVALGNASSPISINYGSSSAITLVITAPDGVSTRTYTVAVTRPLTVTYASSSDVPLSINGLTATGATVSFALNYAPAPGTNLTVVNNTGQGFIGGVFSNLAQGQAVPLNYNGITYNFVANYYGGSGNDLVLMWANSRALIETCIID